MRLHEEGIQRKAQHLVGTYIPGVGNELKLPIALALIVTVLVVKPNGLFGKQVVTRV